MRNEKLIINFIWPKAQIFSNDSVVYFTNPINKISVAMSFPTKVLEHWSGKLVSVEWLAFAQQSHIATLSMQYLHNIPMGCKFSNWFSGHRTV